MKKINGRESSYDINDIFLARHSPRAMAGVLVSQEEILTLLEAARWAPSAGNNQPWRFLYAVKGTPDFDLFFSFLSESNQVWCENAGALIIGLSKKDRVSSKGEIISNPTHSFDAGSAWENLALQGSVMNLVIHGMAGYNAATLKETLSIGDNYQIEIMVAVGYPGKIEDLPELLREREVPSQRKPLEEIAFEGSAGAKKL